MQICKRISKIFLTPYRIYKKKEIENSENPFIINKFGDSEKFR